MSLEQQIQLESQFVMPTFGRKPVEFVRGEGMYLFDDKGKEYLDFFSGIGVVSLGHCHPAVVEALSAQAKRLIHVGNYYYIENRGEVAALLSGILNEGQTGGAQTGSAQLDSTQRTDQEDTFVQDDSPISSAPTEDWQSFFANSGAEANECAIKLARLAAKKKGRNAQNIVTLKRSFHGRTLATLSATAQPAKQEAFQPLPGGFLHAPINDIENLEALFAEQGDSICAVMVECVQGEGGVYPCTQEFLAAAEKLVHDHGALLICDEVQSGIYRCGIYPFAYQHFGISPDIVTIAKGVASGFPCGMCSAKASVAEAFEPGDHGSTFGGSALAIAATKATLETIQASDIPQRVDEVGAYLRAQLAELPQVTEVRGMGLMCACDLKDPIDAPSMMGKAIDFGLLINATGPHTLRFLPPLICSTSDVDVMIQKLKAIL